MDAFEETRKWLYYALIGMAADALDIILTSVIPDKRPQRSIIPSDVDKLSNEEILELRKNAHKLHPDASVFKLTPGTVAKASQDMDKDAADASEANARLDLFFSRTTIPVPRVRRVMKREWDHMIVIDYIPGLSGTCSSLANSFDVAKNPSSATTPPGPLSMHGARICESPGIFGPVRSDRGPFASYFELSAFFNDRHRMAMNAKKLPQGDPLRNDLFDDSEPLVLTHQDLNLRNIILGEDGRLWIIDWGWAGYYPAWFEYVAMRRQNEEERISGTDDKFWKAMVPFICGPYFRQERWVWGMAKGLNFG